MRARMRTVIAPAEAIDTCGTGGDARGTWNISTAAALVAAGAGAVVAKHGNKAASSKSGSAEVLESAGVNLMAEPHQVERALNEAGVAFLFAQPIMALCAMSRPRARRWGYGRSSTCSARSQTPPERGVSFSGCSTAAGWCRWPKRCAIWARSALDRSRRGRARRDHHHWPDARSQSGGRWQRARIHHCAGRRRPRPRQP